MAFTPGVPPGVPRDELDPEVERRLPAFEAEGYRFVPIGFSGDYAVMDSDRGRIYVRTESDEAEVVTKISKAMDNRHLSPNSERPPAPQGGGLAVKLIVDYEGPDLERELEADADSLSTKFMAARTDALLGTVPEYRAFLSEHFNLPVPKVLPFADDDELREATVDLVRRWPPHAGGVDGGITIALAVLVTTKIVRLIRDHFRHGVLIDARTDRPLTVVVVPGIPHGKALVVRDEEQVVLDTAGGELSDLFKLLERLGGDSD